MVFKQVSTDVKWRWHILNVKYRFKYLLSLLQALKSTEQFSFFPVYRTFIVERQPPQVLKKETKFGVVIRYETKHYVNAVFLSHLQNDFYTYFFFEVVLIS